jgi:hypothetical protein
MQAIAFMHRAPMKGLVQAGNLADHAVKKRAR